jgi:hypothetical protein
MITRIKAMSVISKRKLFEVFISPGYYIAMALGLLLGFFLTVFFVDSIGSSGFRPDLNPVYAFISRLISGVFGPTFVEKLFAEGPFLFALFISFLPVLIYLATSSVFKFGFEKNVGAIELITYGPADGTSYFLASLIKDILLTGIYLILLFVFFVIAAIVNNLVLGFQFFFALFLIFFFSISVYAYGILSSVSTDNEASSLALFIAIFVLFGFIQVGSFALTEGYVRNLSSVLGLIAQWFSPLFFWQGGLDAVDSGKIFDFFFNLMYLVILSSVLLFISHFIIKAKGVRA